MSLILLGWWSKRLGLLLKISAFVVIVLGAVAGPYIAARIAEEYQKTLGSGGTLVPQTLQFRWNIWRTQYFPSIGQRPLLGWGVVLPPVITWVYTESQYVTVLMRGGFPLLAAYVAMMVALASAAGALRHDTTDGLRRVSAQAVLALVIILAVMNIIFPYMEDSGLPQPFWVLVAVMMATVPSRLPAVGLAPLPGRGGRIGRAYPAALASRDRLDQDGLEGIRRE